jgi:predicted PurR-regulated permease PerM
MAMTVAPQWAARHVGLRGRSLLSRDRVLRYNRGVMRDLSDFSSNSSGMEHRTFDLVLAIALRLGVVVLLGSWCFAILRPFLIPVVWAVIIASAGAPLRDTLRARLHLNRLWSAVVFVVLLCSVLLVPAVMLSGALFESVRSTATRLQSGELHIPPPPAWLQQWPAIHRAISPWWAKAATDFAGFVQTIRPQLQDLGEWLLRLVAGTGLALLQFCLAIVVSGIVLYHDRAMVSSARQLAARLGGERGVALVQVAGSTVRSVTRGVLGVALLQAALAGVGFVVVGLPGAGVWALVAFVLAIVQVGVLPVIVPAVAYVFVKQSTAVAVAFLVWSVLVGGLDNVLKPILLGRGVQVPLLVVFMGTIGGLMAWGMIGLFVGSVGLVVGYQVFVAWLRLDAPASEFAEDSNLDTELTQRS